jgi:hypothetical protein
MGRQKGQFGIVKVKSWQDQTVVVSLKKIKIDHKNGQSEEVNGCSMSFGEGSIARRTVSDDQTHV